MDEADARGSADESAEKLIDQDRRDALTRFAKYTAPAMLAVLISTSGKAAAFVSGLPT